MANTEVGTISSTTSTAPTTLALLANQAAALGAVRIFRSSVVSTTVAPSALSGGNVAAGAWSQGFGPSNDNQGTVRRHSIWFGTVANANGSQHETITITWSGTITGIAVDLDCITIDPANTSASWTQDGSALTIKNNTSSTTITYPAATSGGTGRVYAGFARASSGGAYGNPSGGTTETDANGNPAINLLAVGSGAITPTQTSNATISNTAGILLVPSAAVVNTQTLSATTTGVASLSKVVIKAQSATTTAVPSLAKLVTKPLSATTTGVASLSKLVKKGLSATTVGVASILSNKVFTQTLSAVTVGVASLTKVVTKPLAATTTAVPSLSKVVKANRSAVTTGAASVLKLVKKGLSAVTTGLASVSGVKVPAAGPGFVDLFVTSLDSVDLPIGQANVTLNLEPIATVELFIAKEG